MLLASRRKEAFPTLNGNSPYLSVRWSKFTSNIIINVKNLGLIIKDGKKH